ncbi:hypothetical protein NE865_06350 [Phthorimaea operculella]|nr:hypothetical protein NE865_06350 [Phthorimaea operculella]
MAESEAISALVRKRGNLKGNITKLINSFASKEFTKFELVRMQERLRSTFDKYENCNLEICAIDETKSDADFEATENIVPITKSTAQNIRQFVSVVKQQLAALKNLGKPVDQWDDILLTILARKLDTFCSREFQLARNKEPKVSDLLDFLETRALALENVDRPLPAQSTQWSGERPKVSHAAVKSPMPTSCLMCKSSAHKLYLCAQFKLLSAAERLKFVEEHEICKICLNIHKNKCRYYYFTCDQCKEKGHNTLLHQSNTKPPVSLISQKHDPHTLLPTVRVKLFAKDGTEVHVKALLDGCSQASLITTELANLLQLEPKDVTETITGVGNATSNICKSVSVQVHSLTRDFKMKVHCNIMDEITTMLPQFPFKIEDLELPPNLVLADDKFNVPSKIHILLGANVLFQTLLHNDPEWLQSSLNKQHVNNEGLPLFRVINTLFGHVVGGDLPASATDHQAHSPITLHCLREDDTLHTLNENLNNFFQVEKVPEYFPEKLNEFEACEKMFCDTVKLDTENKKFQVGLPLKLPLESVKETLGDLLYLALKRFNNLELRFKKDPFLFGLYKDFIHDYIEQGHGTFVDIDKYDLENDPVCFIPHHPVLKLDRKTTKCRVVMDFSMKTSKKVSVNDLLYNGPISQKSSLTFCSCLE